MNKIKVIVTTTLLVIFALPIYAANDNPEVALVGTWTLVATSDSGQMPESWVFNNDGTFKALSDSIWQKGTYWAVNDVLVIKTGNNSSALDFEISTDGKTLLIKDSQYSFNGKFYLYTKK